MQVQDVMARNVVSVTPEESVAVAARLLSRYNLGALPVCAKDGKLRGLVTDRDIVLRCVAAEDEATGTKVADIMTRRLVRVSPETELGEATQLMAREKVRRLPVEQEGRLVGMLSLGDTAKLPDFTTEAAAALREISHNTTHRKTGERA